MFLFVTSVVVCWKFRSINVSMLIRGKIGVSSLAGDKTGNGDDSIVSVGLGLENISFFFSSFSTIFGCSIGAWVVSDEISFFFFSAAFAPKHDAHRPPVDCFTLVFLTLAIDLSGCWCFSFVIANVGNGPGLTNSTSGRSTAAPCKFTVVFEIVVSKVFGTAATTAISSTVLSMIS